MKNNDIEKYIYNGLLNKPDRGIDDQNAYADTNTCESMSNPFQ